MTIRSTSMGAAASLALLVGSAGPSRAGDDGHRAPAREAVERIAERIHEFEPGTCDDVDWAGWGGYSTRRCTYRAGDVESVVVLANASPKRVAHWLVSACVRVKATNIEACAEKLRGRMQRIGDYQFPIAGIVLEDLDPDVPGPEGYAFRDGVTVRARGFENGSAGPFSADQIRAALHGEVVQVLRLARPIGTSREHYVGAGGVLAPGGEDGGAEGLAWLSVTRTSHQTALRGEAHALVDAWALAHVSLLR